MELLRMEDISENPGSPSTEYSLSYCITHNAKYMQYLFRCVHTWGKVRALRYSSEFPFQLSANGSFMYTGTMIRAVKGVVRRRSKSVC